MMWLCCSRCWRRVDAPCRGALHRRCWRCYEQINHYHQPADSNSSSTGALLQCLLINEDKELSPPALSVSHNLPACWPPCAQIADIRTGRAVDLGDFVIDFYVIGSEVILMRNTARASKWNFRIILPEDVLCITHSSHLVKCSMIGNIIRLHTLNVFILACNFKIQHVLDSTRNPKHFITT